MDRSIAFVFVAGMLSGPYQSAGAQAYPVHPLRIVVPLTAGGSADILARTIAVPLGKMWGQQVIVENRPGANTIIGAEAVAKSKPDGYTLLLAVQGTMTLNPVTYRSLPYNSVTDFDPVSQLTSYGYVLVAHPSIPARNVRELVGLAKARRETLAYSTSGIGGSNHLAGELFRLSTGLPLNAVAYKGSAPALNAVLAGEVDMTFDNLITSIPHIRSGRLRGLGVTAASRSSSLPEIPTLQEAGLSGYQFSGWQSVVAPAGTPRGIIRKLHGDLVKVVAFPEVREAIVVRGASELVGSTPEELAALIRSDIERYRKLIQRTGIALQ